MSIEPTTNVTRESPVNPLNGARVTPPHSQMLSAWTDDHLTSHQLQWIRAEHELLCSLLKQNDAIVDVGCGDARVLNQIVKVPFASYVGIDSDNASIETAKGTFSEPRCKFRTADALDILPQLSSVTPNAASSLSRRVVICIGNTIGTFEQKRAEAVRAMASIADYVVISVCKNSPDVMLRRLEYYEKNNLACRVEDWRSGSIWSEMWGESRSFNHESLRELARLANVHDCGFIVSTQLVGEMGIALILNRAASK